MNPIARRGVDEGLLGAGVALAVAGAGAGIAVAVIDINNGGIGTPIGLSIGGVALIIGIVLIGIGASGTYDLVDGRPAAERSQAPQLRWTAGAPGADVGAALILTF